MLPSGTPKKPRYRDCQVCHDHHEAILMPEKALWNAEGKRKLRNGHTGLPKTRKFLRSHGAATSAGIPATAAIFLHFCLEPHATHSSAGMTNAPLYLERSANPAVKPLNTKRCPRAK